MYQVAPRIWNRIAETQELLTPMARRLFPVDPEEMSEVLQKEEDGLVARKVPPVVAAAYLVVAPLLWEEKAIQAFVAEQDDPALLRALPDVVGVEEAVTLASRDYPLTGQDQNRLRTMLQVEPA